MYDTFKPVRIFISDLHVVLKGVNAPSTLREEVRFLGSAAEYRAAYWAGAAAGGEAIQLVPLDTEELEDNRFLRAYTDLLAADADPWLLQLPFVYTPPGPPLRLSVPELSLEAPVRCFGFVWPCGWGLNLEIELDQGLSSDHMLRLSRILRDRTAPGAFVTDGEDGRLGVSALFRRLSEQLAPALYTASPGTNPTVDAKYVIAVADPKGTALPYLDATGGTARLPSYVRERLQSVLEGKTVTAEALADLEASLTWQHPDPVPEHPPRVILSKLTGNDFAISRFELGTLIVATENLKSGTLTLRQLHCLAANMRTVWQQLLLLAYTVEYASKRKLLGNPAVLELADQAQALLNALPGSGHFFARRLSDSRHSAIEAARTRVLAPPK